METQHPIKPMVVNSQLMDWQPSPSPKVWRKRLYHEGEVESGVVTSIVRYDPGSQFRSHPHPQGEEILVLEGVFSDEHGDYPAGSYLLNPEGVSHAPYSKTGCVLFVKLRQYAGQGRVRCSIDTNKQPWQPSNHPQIGIKSLYRQQGFDKHMQLERWQAGTQNVHHYPNGGDILVLSGQLQDESNLYPKGSWLNFPEGASHQCRATTETLLYRCIT